MTSGTQRAGGFLGPEFNAFLFAPVGLDRAGSPLSVVSALARLDLDAWAEAAKLAGLPKDTAATRLSALITRFTDVPLATRDAKTIAARLVTLLPAQDRLASLPSTMPLPKGLLQIGLIAAVLFIVLLGYQMGTQTAAPAAAPPAQALSTAAPPAPHNVRQ